MEDFFGLPDDEVEKAEGSEEKKDRGEYFSYICHNFINLSHFAIE